MSKATEKKELLIAALEEMKAANESAAASLTKQASVNDYVQYTYLDEQGIRIWTNAIQKAIDENEIVVIPEASEPYYINASITIPSNRYIKASSNAVIRQREGVRVLMIRNVNTLDGSHAPIDKSNPDRNITISGGIWEEWCAKRYGYGVTGKYDEERSFYGVTTCMFFDNIEGLTLKNMLFRHTAGFSVQSGDAKNVVIENIEFQKCYADGIHLTGNCENVYVRNVHGYVGDDLVALNAYDWKNSSVNFGPSKNIYVKDIDLSDDSPVRCVRLQPGTYTFDNGDKIDCSLSNVVFSGSKGIQTYKFYLQTAPYNVNEGHEPGEVSFCEDVFFENMDIHLNYPIDYANIAYRECHPIIGSFGSFEICANMSLVSFENINFTVDKEKYPLAFLCTVGPKTWRTGDREIFNPDVSCTIDEIYLRNITINGKVYDNIDEYLHEVDFTSIGGGKGTIKSIDYAVD